MGDAVQCEKVSGTNYDYEICGVNLKSVQRAKDLGVKIAVKLKFSEHCNDAGNKANRMLNLIKKKKKLRIKM